MRIILKEGGLDINAEEDEKYDFIIKASKGNLEFEEIRGWIIDNIK